HWPNRRSRLARCDDRRLTQQVRDRESSGVRGVAFRRAKNGCLEQLYTGASLVAVASRDSSSWTKPRKRVAIWRWVGRSRILGACKYQADRPPVGSFSSRVLVLADAVQDGWI